MAAPDFPIACTLGAGDFQDRLAWIADLNRTMLRDAARESPDHFDLSRRRQRSRSRDGSARAAVLCLPRIQNARERKWIDAFYQSARGCARCARRRVRSFSNRIAVERGLCMFDKHGPQMNDAAQSKVDIRGGRIATSAAGLAATDALTWAVCASRGSARDQRQRACLARAPLQTSGIRGARPCGSRLVWVLVQSWRTQKWPAATTVIATLAATAMLALAFSWPVFEADIIAKLGG